MREINRGEHWQHVKRGSLYEIVSTAAHMQCATDPHLESYEDEDWIAYWPVANPVPEALTFRMRAEFLDGRFVKMREAET